MATRQRTEVGRRTAAGPTVDSKSEAVAELMLEVAQCFFRIRAVGQKTGLITSWAAVPSASCEASRCWFG